MKKLLILLIIIIIIINIFNIKYVYNNNNFEINNNNFEINNNIRYQLLLRLTSFEPNTNIRFTLGDAASGVALTAIVAVEHFNQRYHKIAPILKKYNNCNLNISYIAYDTISNPAVATQSYLSLLPKPHFIVGAARSAVSGPVAVAAGVQNVPQISYWSTSPGLSDRSVFPRFARTIPSDADASEKVADLFQMYGYEYAAVLYVNDAYGSAYKESLFTACLNRNINLLAFAFDFQNKESLKIALQSLKETGLNIMVGILFQEDFVDFVEIATELKLIGADDKLWIFTDSVTNVAESLEGKKEIAEALSGSLQVLAVGGIISEPKFQNFANEWVGFSKYLDIINKNFPGGEYFGNSLNYTIQIKEDLFERIVNDQNMLSNAAFIYDAVIAGGIAACDSKLKFSNLNNLDLKSSKLFYDKIKEIKFTGASGKIEFNNVGDRLFGKYRLYNFVLSDNSDNNNLDVIDVGGYNLNNNEWDIESDIFYVNGYNNPPNDVNIPKENQNLLTSVEKGLGWFYVISVYIICMLLLFWTICFRTNDVIKRSQWEFLTLFLVGNIVQISSIIPLMIDTSSTNNTESLDRACMSIPWLYSIGWVLTYAALVAKSYRVWKIFKNSKLRRIRITAQQLFVFVLILSLADGIILLSWTLVAPLYWDITVVSTDRYLNPLESYGSCKTNNIYFLLGLASFHILVLLAGVIMGYKVRHVPDSFQEYKWINIAMISMLQIFVVGIPAVAAVYDIPLARFYLLTSMIFVNSIVLILVIFVPKLNFFIKRKKFDDSELSKHTGVNKTITKRYNHNNKNKNSDNTNSNNTNKRNSLLSSSKYNDDHTIERAGGSGYPSWSSLEKDNTKSRLSKNSTSSNTNDKILKRKKTDSNNNGKIIKINNNNNQSTKAKSLAEMEKSKRISFKFQQEQNGDDNFYNEKKVKKKLSTVESLNTSNRNMNSINNNNNNNISDSELFQNDDDNFDFNEKKDKSEYKNDNNTLLTVNDSDENLAII